MKQYFITGTDTEVGKTYVTAQLLSAGGRLGKNTLGYKPVAAGCERVNDEWVNEDALALHAASSMDVSLDIINPIRLVPPIAPHIAAQEAGVVLDEPSIVAGLNAQQALRPDLLLMEGAGGWRLPLSNDLFMSDVVAHLDLPVILVVGMKLGCLNHALLTAESIVSGGLTLAGWIANDVSGCMSRYDENVNTLKREMPAPLLGEIPFEKAPDESMLAAIIDKLC